MKCIDCGTTIGVHDETCLIDLLDNVLPRVPSKEHLAKNSFLELLTKGNNETDSGSTAATAEEIP